MTEGQDETNLCYGDKLCSWRRMLQFSRSRELDNGSKIRLKRVEGEEVNQPHLMDLTKFMQRLVCPRSVESFCKRLNYRV